ncbi:unnamed protein product, partial [Mesorhabditis belari]|uniref:UDP-glucuronosyltransferase n=1 Tax=Mesorhabditis belari TaxID=2138241 RepID=A0AAF3FRM3_9BILA
MKTLIYLLLAFVTVNECALNVLVYNIVFSHSHSRQTGLIADILAQAGHNVTELVPLANKAEYKRKSKYVKEIVIEQNKELGGLMDGGSMDELNKALWVNDPSPMAAMELFKNLTLMLSLQCETSMQSEIIEQLKGQKFDLAVCEVFDFCGYGLAEMIGVKTVIAYSTSILLDHQALLLGIPRVPSYVPASMGNTNEKMSVLQRASNAFSAFLGGNLFLGIADAQTELFRKHIDPKFTDLQELVSRSALLVTNAIPLLDFPHPTLHKVISAGGMGQAVPKPLNEEWVKTVSTKPKTVLISFGSIAKSSFMSPAQKASIKQMAKDMPDVQFIWKYEEDDLKDLPANLLLSKWTPQSDLLASGKIDLFVTHGGLGSTTELAYSGIPAIVIPIMGDQPRNARMLERHGSAQYFSKFDLGSTGKLTALVTKMLNDQSYKESAVKLATILNNAPFKPQEVLLKNIEFVGKFGALPQLDPYGRQLSFAQYFLVDIIIYSILLVAFVIFAVFWAIRRCFRKVFQSGKSKSD